jgi:hypothetical protein
MISCGAFSIFKRFSAREKLFHEMPGRRMGMFWERGKGKGFLTYNNILFIYKNRFKERSIRSRVQLVQRRFKCSRLDLTNGRKLKFYE